MGELLSLHSGIAVQFPLRVVEIVAARKSLRHRKTYEGQDHGAADKG